MGLRSRIIFYIFCSFLNFVSFANTKQIVLKVALSEDSPPMSYVENGEATGLLKDLLVLIFEQLPEYKLEFYAQPWNRAQYQVQNNDLDLFVTYPSENRKVYANFLPEILYTWDYSYLIYNNENPNKQKIEQAKSFDDLRGLIFLSQEGVDWERENVPSFIKRLYLNKIDGMIHSLFRRNSGDFFIMSAEQATYYAEKFGYKKKLGIKKVNLITNAEIHFHIGVRKTFKGNEQLLLAISNVLKTPAFMEKRKRLAILSP